MERSRKHFVVKIKLKSLFYVIIKQLNLSCITQVIQTKNKSWAMFDTHVSKFSNSSLDIFRILCHNQDITKKSNF